MNKRPLIIFDDTYKKGRVAQAGVNRQNLLLKGMMIYGDVDKAADYAGIRTAVDLYRTFDRIAIRKGYHQALTGADIDLPWIVERIKGHADGANPQVSLSALRMLLASLGLNRYDVAEEGQKRWEDTLLELSERYESKQLTAPTIEAYHVNVPQTPEAAKLMRAKEQEIGKELYEHESGTSGQN